MQIRLKFIYGFLALSSVVVLGLFQNCQSGFRAAGLFPPNFSLAQACELPVVPHENISETCLYTATESLISYAPKYPLWSDGSEKTRYLYLPPNQMVETQDPNNWRYPVGTVFYKHFVREMLTVETRQIEKFTETDWRFTTYQWNTDQTEATLVATDVFDALGTGHNIPATSKCTNCHSLEIGEEPPLGFNRLQLSQSAGSFSFLESLHSQNILSSPVDELEIVGSDNAKAALGYLHVNCGTCHRDNGFCADQTSMRLNYDFETTDVNSSNVITKASNELFGTLDCSDTVNFSDIYCNIALGVMPNSGQTGLEQVDTDGLDILENWLSEFE